MSGSSGQTAALRVCSLAVGSAALEKLINRALELFDRDWLFQHRTAAEQRRQPGRAVAGHEQKGQPAPLNHMGDRVDPQSVNVDIKDGEVKNARHRKGPGFLDG